MKLYADLPVRRTLQAAGDLLLVLWVVAWIKLGDIIHDSTMLLAKPGHEINYSATGLAARLRDAGSAVGGVPLIGKDVSKPFDSAAGAADQLAAAGRSQVAAVHTLAFWLGLCVTLIPVLIGLALHLPRRIQFVRRATAGQRVLSSSDDLELFALRALARRPLDQLARISTDPAGDWRAGDPDVVRRLAELELRAGGLVLPRVATSS
ncbi:MAG: hypothetical protein M3Z50_09895 [Actinomycetota bacterium]|nr:hypothetical protein [Actinomycetota bacterium]